MFTGSLEHLRKPFAANVEPGMNVHVLSDTAHDPRVWQAVMSIISELHAEPTLSLFEPRPADYLDPPRIVVEAMRRADINVLLATTAMLHSDSAEAAMQAGVPAIVMDGGLRLEHFQAGAVTADYAEILRVKHFVATNVYGPAAKTVRVTSEAGTDVTYSVEGRIYVPPLKDRTLDPFKFLVPKREGRPTSPLYMVIHPTGEFNVPPVEDSANGTIVIDTTMHQIGRLTQPIRMTVRDGRVVTIEGGPDARKLRDYLATYGDPGSYVIGEAALGLNPEARIVGIQREDKNVLGALHFGLGRNSDVGGTNHARLHMDGVILEPTVEVDGVVRVRNGEYQVPLDRYLDA